MIDLTLISYLIAGIAVYYVALFVMSLRPRTVTAREIPDLLFVTLVAARNEERVIDPTLRSLLRVEAAEHLVIVINDGSSDNTSELAHQVASESHRVIVLDRDPVVAGRGKSDALNDGYRLICEMRNMPNSSLARYQPENTIIQVVDADGRIDAHAFTTVAGHFVDPSVGAVQIGVRIRNATDGLLPRLQDMEFVAFSGFVQIARDRLGSVGLGGNGQFTRFSALQSLGDRPWDIRSLTEDFDLGLRLTTAGWQMRYCPDTAVSQQGLTRLRPLFRQRTRWMQGHYQCWKHYPRVMRSPGVRWYTRLDLMTYLFMVVTITLLFSSLVLSVLGAFGVLDVRSSYLDFLTANEQRYVTVALAITPLTLFLYSYQRRSVYPLKTWELPAYGAALTVYSYFWVLATLRAWLRMATGRWTWAKTPRLQS
jgi:cellulose synthase/poly-beta-1,6-N-acetylglucosamine synthase-like glycosyltransferase